MPSIIEAQIRPATPDEEANINWRPANRTSKSKERPFVDSVLAALGEDQVVVIGGVNISPGKAYDIRREITETARKRRIPLNTSVDTANSDTKGSRIFVRKDPKLHPEG